MFRLSLQPTLCRLQFVNAGFLAAGLFHPKVDICEFCELIDFGNGTDRASPFCLFTGKFRWHGANAMQFANPGSEPREARCTAVVTQSPATQQLLRHVCFPKNRKCFPRRLMNLPRSSRPDRTQHTQHKVGPYYSYKWSYISPVYKCNWGYNPTYRSSITPFIPGDGAQFEIFESPSSPRRRTPLH